MHRFALAVCVAAALAHGAGPTADEVKAAEKEWAQASVAADAARLDKILADDLVYTHSTGADDSKAEFIGHMKTGFRRYHTVDHESMDVKLYGDWAILRATARVQTSASGAMQPPVRLKFIHVWVRRKGAWRLLAHQSLRLPG